MVIDLLESVLASEAKTAFDLKATLDRFNFKLFDRVFQQYNGEEPYFVILYILYAFSEKSPFLILNAENMYQKESIAKTLQIPEYLVGKLLYNRDLVVRSCIVDYLNYQQHSDFRHLKMKEIMYDYLSEQIVSTMSVNDANNSNSDNEDDAPAKKGGVDFKTTIDAMKQLDKVYEEITELRKTLHDKYEFVRINELAVLADGTVERNFGSANVESSPYVR